MILTSCLSIYAKRHGTSAGNLNAMIFFVFGKWHFKLWRARETIFLIYLMLISMSSNLLTLKEVLGYNGLDTWTRYVCKQPELLLIMLQSVNIDLDSSLRKNLSVYVAHTQLNHEDIFFIIAEDSMAIGICQNHKKWTWFPFIFFIFFLSLLSFLIYFPFLFLAHRGRFSDDTRALGMRQKALEGWCHTAWLTHGC